MQPTTEAVSSDLFEIAVTVFQQRPPAANAPGSGPITSLARFIAMPESHINVDGVVRRNFTRVVRS